jgi:hypothetical protein
MGGMKTNLIFRRLFGDAFPSSSALAIDLCKRGEITQTSQLAHLGCGVGTVSSLISSHFSCAIMGVESISQLIEIANVECANELLKFECAPLHKTPFPSARYTHILTEANLSVYRQPIRLLNEASRLLVNDGLLLNSEIVITDVSRLDAKVSEFLTIALGDDSTYTLDDWVSLLETSGFSVIQAQIEPSIMRSNGKKLRRALFGVNLLRRTKQISFSELGLEALEDDFDAISKATLTAIDNGIITYASFISKPNNTRFYPCLKAFT